MQNILIYLNGAISCNSTDREDGGHEDCVGNGELQDRLQHPGVPHNVADPEEEQGGEHGQGDGGEHALDGSQRSLLIL